MGKKSSTEFNFRIVLMFKMSDADTCGEEAQICNLQYFSQARLEISRDRRDRRSCKIVSSCVIFPENNALSWNICGKV